MAGSVGHIHTVNFAGEKNYRFRLKKRIFNFFWKTARPENLRDASWKSQFYGSNFSTKHAVTAARIGQTNGRLSRYYLSFSLYYVTLEVTNSELLNYFQEPTFADNSMWTRLKCDIRGSIRTHDALILGSLVQFHNRNYRALGQEQTVIDWINLHHKKLPRAGSRENSYEQN